MKKKIRLICCLMLLTLSNSCDYLDVVPDNVSTMEMVFTTRHNAEKMLTTCYGYLPEHGNVYENPGLGASEEVWNCDENSHYYKNTSSFRIAQGLQNVNDPYLNYWSSMFIAIRDCNLFIENIDNVPDMTSTEKTRWKSEVMILKAYYHYWLLQLYGPIPFVDKNIDVSASIEGVKTVRQPVDFVVSEIVKLIDDAVALDGLPLNILATLSEMGRLTKPAALAIKAKVLSLAASPLFNGNQDFPDFKNKEGVELINSVYDPTKWVAARDALKMAIDVCHEAGHELYRFNEPMMFNISDTTHLELTLRNTITGRFTRELIWGIGDNGTEDLAKISYPALTAYHQSEVPIGMHNPTLDVAEQFYTNNGLPIDYDNTWSYDDRYKVDIVPANHEYYIEEGARSAKLNFNREPRYYAWLGFDTGKWFNMEVGSDKDSYTLRNKQGEVSGQNLAHYSITGFFAKKLVNYKLVLTEASNTYSQSTYAFPIIRLADLYLLYAEVLNETKEKPDAEVYEYIQKVRDKAGLDVTTGSLLETWKLYSTAPSRPEAQDGMREIIHQERLIELSFEGQRFYDLRRWKKSLEYCSRPIRGWNTLAKSESEYYQVKYVFHRKFSPRDYFWPIELDEIYRNRELVQSPLW